MPFISHLNTQALHFKPIIHNSIAMFSPKHYTPVGFEPRSSVPEADATELNTEQIGQNICF
jgi:hypothetical protein